MTDTEPKGSEQLDVPRGEVFLLDGARHEGAGGGLEGRELVSPGSHAIFAAAVLSLARGGAAGLGEEVHHSAQGAVAALEELLHHVAELHGPDDLREHRGVGLAALPDEGGQRLVDDAGGLLDELLAAPQIVTAFKGSSSS